MSKKGVAHVLTSDHRPEREDERTRIENLVVNFIKLLALSFIFLRIMKRLYFKDIIMISGRLCELL